MITYFPRLYPDELFQSIIARYSLHAGFASPERAFGHLFGGNMRFAKENFPLCLPALGNHLSTSTDFSVVHFIQQSTLIPYYLAFARERTRRDVLAGLMHGDGRLLRQQFGRSTKRFKEPSCYRYCVQCNEVMIDEFGELYWRRTHQLPGVIVCVEHACPLHESTVPISTRGRIVCAAADERHCPLGGRALIQRANAWQWRRLHEIAFASQRLLSGSAIPATADFRSWYQAQLASMGLCHSPTRIKQSSLKQCVTSYYRGVLDLLPFVTGASRLHANWLSSVTTRPANESHPLYHILLQLYLAQAEHPPPNIQATISMYKPAKIALTRSRNCISRGQIGKRNRKTASHSRFQHGGTAWGCRPR